jgi:hypothetical protein
MIKIILLTLFLLLWSLPDGVSVIAQSHPVSATLTASPMIVVAGSPVTLDYTVTNDGDKQVNGITIYLSVYSDCDRDGNGTEDYYPVYEELQGPMTLQARQVVSGSRSVVIPNPPGCYEYYAYLVVKRNQHGTAAIFRDIYITH